MYTKNKRPFMIFAISFLAGTALALSLGLYIVDDFSGHGIVGLISAICLYILLKDKTKLSEAFIICLMGVCLSFISCNGFMKRNYYPAINVAGASEEVVIKVDQDLGKGKSGRYSYIVSVIGAEDINKFRDIRCRISLEEPVEIGDAIQCTAKFNLPRNSLYFNYERYLASIGIFLTGSVDEESIVKLDTFSSVPIVDTLCQKAKDNIYKYIPDTQSAALVISLTTEDEGLIDPGLYSVFADSGLSHIISSGSTIVTFLSVAMVELFRKIGFSVKFSSFLGLLMIVVVALTLGLKPSVVRSAIVGIVYFSGKIIDRRSDPVTSLAFAATLATIWNPFIIYSMAFVFSYVSYVCLVTFVPNILRVCREKFSSVYKYSITKNLFEVFIVSMIINIVLLPINIFYFRKVAVYAVVANVFVALLVPVIVFLGAILIILGFIPYTDFSSSIIGKIAGMFSKLFLDIADLFANMPYSTIYVWGAYVVICLCIVLGIVCFLAFIRKINQPLYKRIRIPSSFFCVLIVSLGYIISSFNTINDVSLSAVNISRSNSYVLFDRENAVVVLSKSNYNDSNAILDYLDKNGVYKISALIILDEGKNNVQNAFYILDDIKVDTIVAPSGYIDGRDTIDLENREIKIEPYIYIEIIEDSLYVNLKNVSVGLYGKKNIDMPVIYGMYVGESKRDFVPDAKYIIGYHKYNTSVQEITGDEYDDVFIKITDRP